MLPKRKQIRLKGYDYSQNGYYFVTICTQDKGNVMGEITGGDIKINVVGKMVEKWWLELANKYLNVKLWEYVLMPNHLHGIIEIQGTKHVGADLCVDPQSQENHIFTPGGHAGPPLPGMIQWFKTMTTNSYYKGVHRGDFVRIKGKLWQRNYY